MSSERISTFFPGTERPAEAEKPVEEEKILQEQLQENMADLVEYRLGEGQPITEEKRSNVMKVEATEMAKVREEIERIKEMKSFVAKLKGGEELSVEDKNRAKEVIGGWLADISNQQKENFDKIKSFDSDKARLEQEYEDMSADLAAKQAEYLKKDYNYAPLDFLKRKAEALVEKIANMPEKKNRLQAKQEWLGKAMANAQDALNQIEKI